MRRNLKVFVWEDVLADYTNGMMFAIAENVEEARKLLIAKCSYIPTQDLYSKPKIITTKDAFYVWGGG